jgi:hypothetical protein
LGLGLKVGCAVELKQNGKMREKNQEKGKVLASKGVGE